MRMDPPPPAQVSLEELAFLTAAPHAEDVVVGCLPVCAPYSTLAAYRYKVKLTPGAQKKGRAARQAMDAFMYAKVTMITNIFVIRIGG